MIKIDGSQGEGGGQILRSSLALSLCTGQAFRIENIRARRKKPGLLHQHLTAVLAARAVGEAEVSGAELGSQFLEFRPGKVRAGRHRFAVGTAGSATLVLQTILPPLLTAEGTSFLALEGGTHNPLAPPFDFLTGSFLPLVERLGARVQCRLERPGFYPAGGGRFEASIEPAGSLGRLELMERGPIVSHRARALVSRLPAQIAERELAAVCRRLGWSEEACGVETVSNALGTGNALLLEAKTDTMTHVFSGMGERGRTAEDVADGVCEAYQAWCEANVPVDEPLADQLLLPMALGQGGQFRTVKPSLHTVTNAEVIERFLGKAIRFEQESALVWCVHVA